MIDSSLRIRVERLLKGDIRIEDISTLFLAMRDRHPEKETVVEIGDFIAHRTERQKGITTQNVREFFAVSRYLAQYNLAGIALNLTFLPHNIKDVLQGAFRRIDSKILRKHTGQKRLALEKQLIDIEKRILQDVRGTLYLAWPTEQDVILIRCLTSFLVSKAAFGDRRLFDEFCDVLLKEGLLIRQEMKAFTAQKKAIALFAVSYMHESIVDLGDGTKGQLLASANTGHGKIGVMAIAPVRRLKVVNGVLTHGGDVNFASPIFETSFNARECCEPDLLATPNSWGFPLELTSKGTLARLA